MRRVTITVSNGQFSVDHTIETARAITPFRFFGVLEQLERDLGKLEADLNLSSPESACAPNLYASPKPSTE